VQLLDPVLSSISREEVASDTNASARQIDHNSPDWIFRKIAKVMIETCDGGAQGCEPCWLLMDAEDKILFVVASGMLDEAAIERIGDTSGFDKAAMRLAMHTGFRARFTVWQRDIPLERGATLH
jgi:hypothetical protein